MGLEKAIQFGKEYRQPYRKAKAFVRGCRNHGNCPWCEDGRTYQDRKLRTAADQALEDWRHHE